LSNHDSPSSSMTMAPAMALALAASFGSVERWREAFIAAARQSQAGARCALSFNPREGTLAIGTSNADEDVIPILEFDPQAGTGADAPMQHVDWAAVYERYQSAVNDASENFAVDRTGMAGAQLLDVRRAGVFEQATQMIPGATWRDPAAVKEWAGSLPRGQQVVVYCVYGHEVGRATALRLRAQGVDAKFLRGGIDGWTAAGLPVAGKGTIPFEASPDGSPVGWESGSTGGGSPRWSVETDTGGAHVLNNRAPAASPGA
jgi:superoxide dismutase, Fe-Mn family